LEASSGFGTGTGADVEDGDQVAVKNEDGKTIATGTLHDTKCQGDSRVGAFLDCFKFTAESVGDADFYEFAIRRHGSEKFKRSELEHNNWQVHLSLS
jgi:hypothetical protein